MDKLVTRSVRHRDRDHDQHREKELEMLARGKKLDGDNDKLLVEYQEPDTDADMNMDSETDQPGEFNQELKDCVATSIATSAVTRIASSVASRSSVSSRVTSRSVRVWIRVCIQVCLHAERECCVRVLGNQLRVDNRDCERMRVQMVHTSVAPDKSNASANNAVFHTHRTGARDAAKTKQFELWQAVKCDVRIKSWKARVSWMCWYIT